MTVNSRFRTKFLRALALLLAVSAYSALDARQFAVLAQDKSPLPYGFDEKDPLPPGGRAPQQLELDGSGQLKRAPDITRKSKAADKARAKAERAERRRRALRALLLRRKGRHVPDNADERDRLLLLLYGHLAKASEKTVARKIVKAIERVWIHSSSDTVSVLMRRALAAEKHKKLDKALKFLGFIVKIAPGYAEGWNQRAYIYFKQKDYARALGDLRRVLALDPNHYKALEGMGQILRDINEKRAALQVFRKLVKVYPALESAREAHRKLAQELLGQKS